MMNRFIYLFLLLGCTALAPVGCTGDPDVEPLSPDSVGEGNACVTIDFGDGSFDEVNITTRATLGNNAESRVGNLFVFIFNSAGDRVYGRFFDPENRVEVAEFGSEKLQKEECWYVVHNSEDDVDPEGRVRIIAPTVTDGSLYILANVNADMVNVSPDKLRFVQSLTDLENLTATLNQKITERNGFFPMTGWAKDVTISSSGITFPRSKENPEDKIMLTRLDAKVVVKLRVAEGYKAYNKDTGSTHKIESFKPLSWQVVNLPRTSFVLPHDTDARDEEGKKEMFNTREVKFETRKLSKEDSFTYLQEKLKKVGHEYEYVYKTDEKGQYILDAEGNKIPEAEKVTVDKPEIHGFSFYMLENRVAAKGNVPTEKPDPILNADRLYEAWGYHARETRLKDDLGAYQPDPNETGDIWKYAPAEGTYLVLKGEVVMALELDDEAKNQQLSADAVYYIHLGDFGGKDIDGDGKKEWDLNNYNIERNTSYTYTITIYGVDNIEIEVQKVKDAEGKELNENQENESGATGHVYVAKEKIFTFDSHFASEVIAFDVDHLTDAKNLTWYVRSPFGREGKPHIVNGVEVPAGLDYQWVQFKRNTIYTNVDGEEVYRKSQEKYDPKAVKNVLEFSKYIKEQKEAYDQGKPNDFRRDFDKEWLDWYNEGRIEAEKLSEEEAKKKDGVWYRRRLYLTIFVNEFYYDADPLTGDVRQDLWKDFVNQPPRLMHILCDAETSLDEDSRSTGSVVTIRQRSIQTIFNTEKPELMTAWGCETIDETGDGLNYYTAKESYSNGEWQKPTGQNVPPIPTTGDGNDSDGNGLYNTARIWGLLTGGEGTDGGNVLTYTPKKWSKYVDPDLDYGLCDGNDDSGNEIRTLRYSCMTRNRDENGNGYIDAKEVKWYMAAISQLGSLYVGDQGLSADAVLYPYDKQSIETPDLDPDDNIYPWRSHIVSSTAYYRDGQDDRNYYPEILWAEEGLATGSYSKTWNKGAGLSVRCVRNLGMEPTSEADAQAKIKDKNNIATQAISVSLENSVYRFDLTNLNPLSIRYYTSQELEPNNEFSVEARAYWVFETGPMSIRTYTYEALKTLILEGKSPCPEGYRTPNIREGALISLRCPLGWQSETSRVSTFYSHGLLGTDQDKGASDIWNYPNNVNQRSNSWVFNDTQVNLDKKTETARVRCVRDVRQ